MQKKKYGNTRGLSDIRSIQSTGSRSIPKVLRSSYLELYILGREKDRLEKETCFLDKRKKLAEKQLQSIMGRIGKLQKEIAREHDKVKTYRNVPTKPLKTMAMSY